MENGDLNWIVPGLCFPALNFFGGLHLPCLVLPFANFHESFLETLFRNISACCTCKSLPSYHPSFYYCKLMIMAACQLKLFVQLQMFSQTKGPMRAKRVHDLKGPQLCRNWEYGFIQVATI